MPETERRNLVLLGATGSIGSNTLRVLREHKDRLNLVGVAAHSRHQELAAICREFKVQHAVIGNESYYKEAKASFSPDVELLSGEAGLAELATLAEADIVLIAVVGACGLRPALAAIEAGKDIALANKELLVLGGAHVIEAARRKNVQLLPTDSEHNAIFQCLQGHAHEQVDRLILTASGGQFRDTAIDALAGVSPEDATRHPNWSMGPKITVDSATMANKGLELIEAHWLFGLEPERIDVVIHPQSVVHSLVQFIDGSMLAQLSPPSMTFAIQHCLLYPDRAHGVEPTTNFKDAFSLDFRPPERERYPCLQLAYEALQTGGAAPAIFNAANEIAVERFLNKAIGYLEIPKIIGHCLENIRHQTAPSLDQLFSIDAQTRSLARSCF
ncbi:MAG: 1-deoxy-D-xylulose-5-phosphate reductoisomerase [Opitutales bacterium]